jgi:dTDP-4-dehydrorhamnose reductase
MRLPRRYLVTGASGQVGGAVRAQCVCDAIDVDTPSRSDFDLTNDASLTGYLDNRHYDAIIHCAAYTAVDRAESEEDIAWQTNAVAPGVIARWCAKHGLPLVHVSTDYVFDGRKTVPYLESDPVVPHSAYGRSKAGGEAAVRDAGGAHAIVRTAWVVSPGGRNFLDTMVRLAREKPETGVVADQFGSPSTAADIADALLRIADRLVSRPSDQSAIGTFHFVNDGEASWHALAEHIFATLEQRGEAVGHLKPITTADYPTPAPRPANSRLSTALYQHIFGQKPRSWRVAVTEAIELKLAMEADQL